MVRRSAKPCTAAFARNISMASGSMSTPTSCALGKAAAAAFPRAQLVGVDIDPLAMLMLRANAAVQGFADRLTIYLADYRNLSLDPIAGKTLFIGNPPYVRHHDIAERSKQWFAA